MAREQFEIQLGHLCNNRCVFCVSGQLTSKGQAPLLDEQMLAERIAEARRAGHRKITLLGGEPTIQPFFLSLVRHSVSLGFEDIVIFSNGSRLARADLVDQIIATGGRFEWRFSFQGATKEAHERTTRRQGSWDQLVASVECVRARGQRVTVNMCVVQQNFASVDRFAELLIPRGVSQLHVDMLNPYDTGIMSDEELSSILPRLSDLAGPLERMVRAFPAGFDVNVGNLPYCLAPTIAPFIHHGGQPTWTVTADDAGDDTLQSARNKYAVKQDAKVKPERCRTCVFDDRCSGVFDAYAHRHGLDELQPVTAERLVQLDPRGSFVALHVRSLLRRVLTEGAPAPFERAIIFEPSLREVTLTLEGERGKLVLSLQKDRPAVAACEAFGVRIVESTVAPSVAASALAALWKRIEDAGARVVHPPGDDAFTTLAPSVSSRLARLRAHAPFGSLRWTNVRVLDERRRAELTFEMDGERVVVWLSEESGRAEGGYRVDTREDHTPSPALVQGIRAIMTALGRLPAAGGELHAR